MRLAVPCALFLFAAASCGQPATPERADATAKEDANPRAAPGLVRWHESVDAARTAAAASSKPVLVFQLLGRLDDELC